jgi:uncharacterized protein with NAD-binding domain and iron-sulfur cluster
VGPIVDTDYLSQEISIRGFWSFYHRIMGLPGPGADRLADVAATKLAGGSAGAGA